MSPCLTPLLVFSHRAYVVLWWQKSEIFVREIYNMDRLLKCTLDKKCWGDNFIDKFTGVLLYKSHLSTSEDKIGRTLRNYLRNAGDRSGGRLQCIKVTGSNEVSASDWILMWTAVMISLLWVWFTFHICIFRIFLA